MLWQADALRVGCASREAKSVGETRIMESGIKALAMVIRHGCAMLIHYADLYFGVAGAWVAAALMLIGFIALLVFL